MIFITLIHYTFVDLLMKSFGDTGKDVRYVNI